MIEKISLAQIATFNNATDIDNLKMVNYIYGSNGTGKTTISNLLYAGDAEIYKHCSVRWSSDIRLKTLVYNKQFRYDNFDKGNIAGVFTLGKATKEQLEEIETLRGELEKVRKDGLKRKETLEKQKNEREKIVADFKQWCWTELFKKHDPFFAKAFEGMRNNSVKFADRVEFEGRNNKSEVCELDDLQRRAQTIFSTTPIRLSKIEIPDIELIKNIEANKIWGKRVVGKADISIAKLIDHLNISDWVNQGRDHLEDDSDICPFCQQRTITTDFKKELESYFDEEYVTNMDLIKKCTDDYIHGTNTLNEAISAIIDRESRNANTKLRLAEFTPLTIALSKAFETNISIIQSKQKESSRSFELTYTTSLTENIITKISEANAEIDKHNKLVDDYKEEKDRLINDVWRYVSNNTSVEQHIRAIDNIDKAIVGISGHRDQLREKYQKINDEIKLKNKNVTSVQPAVDAINDILVHYGFENFRIEPLKDDPNCYQIVRNDGTPVCQTLSEGEVTFITFLYYLQLVNGGDNAENVLEDRILVIDDPISSLDSTVLFIVSSLIKEVIKRVKNQDKTPYNVKQIILLTHNAYFHKEVSFVDGRYADSKDVGYWLIRKINNESKIISCENNNPIRGSYEMLWDELRDMENLSLITVQNTMRRIIEVYFKTMGDYKDEDILDKIEKANEKEICRSLMVWINDGSHCVPDDIYYVPNGETVDSYVKVFRDVFDKLGHIGHYNMMMKEDVEKPKRRTYAVGVVGGVTKGLTE